jgi:hypothetical protein
MKSLITWADILRLVPLLPVSESYDFQSDILIATEEIGSRYFNADAWEALLVARNSGTLSALQNLCWHKLETALAYQAALNALPLLQSQLTESENERAFQHVYFRLRSLSRYFQRRLADWLQSQAPEWQNTASQATTQFGLFFPAL